MTAWGVATTIKAPPDEVGAFFAHHLSIGAAQVILHFDDPDDPAAARYSGIDKVEVVRCDAAYWERVNGGRPRIHETRQTLNFKRAYQASALDWLAHIDGDEFILPDGPVAAELAAQPVDRILCRMEPWEALHSPGLPDDILTADWFRKPIRARRQNLLHSEIFGPFAICFDHGVMSHFVGKAFFRTGIEGLRPRLHGALLGDERVESPGFAETLKLLHFHAQDPERWKAALPYKLRAGAYRFNPALTEVLTGATAQELDMFYTQVMAPPPDLLRDWQARGAVMQVRLGLRDKLAALMDRRAGPLGDL